MTSVLFAVAQDHDLRAALHGGERIGRELVQRDREAFVPEERRQRDGGEPRDVAHPLQLVVGEHGPRHLHEARVLGRLREDVGLVADVGHDRHHELLADRVDRRVRHLREKLVEEVEERARLPREARERGVVAHRADGLRARLRHRAKDQLHVLQRPAEARLGAHEVARDAGRHHFREEARDGDAVLLDPAPVGAAAGVEGLELGVLHEAVRREVEPQERAGAEPAAACDVRGRDVQHARLRREDEEPVRAERPARGAQAVAVERRAEREAVGERDRGGAVPRLHQRGMVFEERAHVAGDVVFRAPRLRQEHHRRMRRVAPRRDEQFEHVVERRRVALARADDRQQLPEVVPEERRGERGLARGEGGEVALERIDLAVVRERAERVRQLPARERVRRIPLVHDGEGRDEVRVRQVRVEPLDLRREQQALVDHRPRRARADVGAGRRLLDHPPHDEQLPLESGFVVLFARGTVLFARVTVLFARSFRPRDEHLPDPRHDFPRVLPDRRRIGRHVAPREHVAPFAAHRGLDRALFAFAAEEHRDAERVRQAGNGLAEERARNPHQQPGAVAGLRVVARRAAVHQALQDREAVRHDFVARLAGKVRHQPDAARVVFVFAPVEGSLSVVRFHRS